MQETFARALTRPPRDRRRPLEPWLVRVATNLGRDVLRRRRRRRYTGSWLPAPVETEDPALPSYEPLVDGRTAAGRYELVESLSLAFLLALEALTPQQRAVLLLRDVFDYSVRETAAALDRSEPNVKTTLHRARRAMAAYDRERLPPTPARAARAEEALMRFVAALAEQDHDAVEALLHAEVRALSDGAGVFFAAKVPVVGRERVARFYANIARNRGAPTLAEVRMVNGRPALVVVDAEAGPGEATRFVLAPVVDDEGRIRALHTVLAPEKLTAIAFSM